jgi:hypothetical protein
MLLPLRHFRICTAKMRDIAAANPKNLNSETPRKTSQDRIDSAARFISTIIYMPV